MAHLIDKLHLMVDSVNFTKTKPSKNAKNVVSGFPIKRSMEDALDYPLTSKKRAALEDVTNAAKGNLTKWHNIKKEPLQDNKVTALQENNKINEVSGSVNKAYSNFKKLENCNIVIEENNDSGDRNVEKIAKDSSDDFIGIISEDVKRVLTIPESVNDVDAGDVNDPFRVGDYAPIIFENMKERERNMFVDEYMQRQTDITEQMRMVLIDWLCEVQQNFELFHETLYLAVKIVDHYLAKVSVARENLQLIGATAMLISSKIEERYPPLLDDFMYICDDAYSRKTILETEKKICYALDFDLNIPVPYRFLRRYGKVASISMENLTLGRYILELTLQEYQFVAYKPSFLAAACLSLTLRIKRCGEWTETLVHYTGYKECDLDALVRKLNALIARPPRENCQVVRTKYSHQVFYEVAKIHPLELESDV